MIGWLTKSGRAVGRLARILKVTEAKLASAEAVIERMEEVALEAQATINGLISNLDAKDHHHADEISVLQTELTQWRAAVPKALIDDEAAGPRPFDVGVMAWMIEVLEGRGLKDGDSVVVLPGDGTDLFGRVRYVRTTIVGVRSSKGAIHDYPVQFVHRTVTLDGQPLPSVQDSAYPPPLGITLAYVEGLAAEVVQLRQEADGGDKDAEIEALDGQVADLRRILQEAHAERDQATARLKFVALRLEDTCLVMRNLADFLSAENAVSTVPAASQGDHE